MLVKIAERESRVMADAALLTAIRQLGPRPIRTLLKELQDGRPLAEFAVAFYVQCGFTRQEAAALAKAVLESPEVLH
jgi:hypothetical protein